METYEKRFAGWIEKEITGDEVEAMYAKAMAAIKENPARKAATPYTPDKSFKKPAKSTVEERRKRIAEKKAAQVSVCVFCPGAAFFFFVSHNSSTHKQHPHPPPFPLHPLTSSPLQKEKLLKAMAEAGGDEEEEEEEEDDE